MRISNQRINASHKENLGCIPSAEQRIGIVDIEQYSEVYEGNRLGSDIKGIP